jgi:hypothetical protein
MTTFSVIARAGSVKAEAVVGEQNLSKALDVFAVLARLVRSDLALYCTEWDGQQVDSRCILRRESGRWRVQGAA